MRKNLVAAGGAAAAIAVVLGVTLSGVLTPSVDGTAVPNEITRALQGIDTASRSLADAPAATYDGTVTMTLSAGSVTVDLTKLTVTAAGDVHGTVRQNGGTVELLQFAGKTMVKGDAAFWRKHDDVRQPAGIVTEASPTGKWVIVEEAFLGIDLRAALRPSRLGLVLAQQDAMLGDVQVAGVDVGRASQTPDRRVNSGVDRSGISVVEVEDADGGVTGTRRFQASAATIGTDDDGVLTGLRGPIGKGFGGDTASVDADLRVTPLDAAGARSFYDTAKTAVAGGGIGSWTMTVSDPAGGLNCNQVTCVVDYEIGNANSGLDNGTVAIALRSSFKTNGRDIGTCNGDGSMPINGRGRSTCSVPFPENADVNSSSRFTLTVTGGIDPAAVDAAVARGTSAAESAKGWTMTAPKASEAARRFNRQVALAPSGYGFTVGDFAFDGRETDGTLLIVLGPGYDEHLVAGDVFDPAWQGSEELLALARDAKAAAGDKPVRMVFAEPRSASAMQRLLGANSIAGVEVVTVPLYAES